MRREERVIVTAFGACERYEALRTDYE
jgi:hypothetical protein